MRTRTGLAIGLLLAGGTAHAQGQDLNEQFKDALQTYLQEGPEAGLPKFTALVDERWAEMSPKGKHSTLTSTMLCEAVVGQAEHALERGAWFFGELPEAFVSLSTFSTDDSPPPPLEELRGSIHLLPLQTGKNATLMYVHNSSDAPIEITGSKLEVAFGYKTRSSSVGNMTTTGTPAFWSDVRLPAGGGTFVQSPKGDNLLAKAMPDGVAVLASEVNSRHPDWIHLVNNDYAQTLKGLRITARVKWGDEERQDVVIARFRKPAEVEEEPVAPDDAGHTEED